MVEATKAAGGLSSHKPNPISYSLIKGGFIVELITFPMDTMPNELPVRSVVTSLYFGGAFGSFNIFKSL